VSRDDDARLDDISAAIDAISRHRLRGDLSDGLVFDAVRVRLIEVGEAVKGLSREARELSPHTPWSDIARMRDLLTHRYFDTSHAVISHTVDRDLPSLAEAVAIVRRDLPR
jgi:uncharacterized protein with HEPN domain